MNVLLAHARFPLTYWGWQHALRIVGKRAALPPLGLLTLAALLPERWNLRLVDLNVRSLGEEELAWADAVLIGGMLVQADSMREVCRRARAAGKRVVVGGPAPSTAPDLFAEAHVVFRGEAEERIDTLVSAVEAPPSERIVLDAPAHQFPDVTKVPVPRYDLIDLSDYASVSLQYSRGCPYRCEFCDVIQIFGRKPRVKAPEQVLAELASLHDHGYRGSIFFVDDNFIGNRPAVRKLLPEITAWQAQRGHPFDLYTEASVNLARDPDLLRAMVQAGFTTVFVGLETPSTEALGAAGKSQNLKLDLATAVETIVAGGLEVQGGFIVGFDQDGPDIFEAQQRFIERTGVPLAMIGLLTALPGTALFDRLSREGRLRTRSTGDQFGRPNFEPRMDEATLLAGYRRLLARIYDPDAYYDRCEQTLACLGPRPPGGDKGVEHLGAFARAAFGIGVRSPRRRRFWRLVRRAAPRGRAALVRAVTHAVMGEHVIRYTQEHVLPHIDGALDELGRERRLKECIGPRPDRSGSDRAAAARAPRRSAEPAPTAPAR
ncbi:MAG: B12-binding domain-containing radical SAM protein [Myxococcota bacterium]